MTSIFFFSRTDIHFLSAPPSSLFPPLCLLPSVCLKEHVNLSWLSARGDKESALDAREIIQRAHMSNAHSSFVFGKSPEFPIGSTTQFPAPPVAATLRVAKV